MLTTYRRTASLPAPAPSAAQPKSAANATPAAAKRTARSRVSNGKQLFLEGDGRGVAVRRYRDLLAALVSDLGGDPSEAQAIIARRAATLAVWCEQAESDMASGNPIDIGSFTTATNALRRLLADLGLERKIRDVTPTLAAYIAAKAANAPAGANGAQPAPVPAPALARPGERSIA
jgi:hypothetical protein